MRKLSWCCEEGAHLHQAARVAITEIGVTKGFKDKECVRTRVALVDDVGREIGHVDTTSWYSRAANEVMVHVAKDDCSADLRLTWSDLKLIGFYLHRCGCDQSSYRLHA